MSDHRIICTLPNIQQNLPVFVYFSELLLKHNFFLKIRLQDSEVRKIRRFGIFSAESFLIQY